MPHEEEIQPVVSVVPGVPGVPGVLTINMRDINSRTPWIYVGKRYAMSADLQVSSAATWSTGVVGMEWSVHDGKYANAVTFSPTVTFTSSIKSLRNIDIASMVYVRWAVTTAEEANDTSALMVYMVE